MRTQMQHSMIQLSEGSPPQKRLAQKPELLSLVVEGSHTPLAIALRENTVLLILIVLTLKAHLVNFA